MTTRFNWRKSSFSGNDANCVEVAWPGAEAAIRDSKNPGAGHLTIPVPALRYLLNTVSVRGGQD